MELYDRLAGGNFNIGCLGGKQVWVDIDEADGKNGEAAWRELLAELGIPEPKTFTVSTARGGRHLCFDAEGELFGGGDLIKGKINVRGCGGYVVGAGSEFVDKDGKRGRYVIIDPTPPAPLPDALKARLRTRGPKLDGPKVIGELDTPEAVALAENHAKTCPPSIERQGGDNNAIEVANRIYDFGISVEECTRIMVAYFNPRCAPPDADWIAVKCLNAWNSRQDPVGRDKPSDGSCFEPIDGPGPKTDGAPQRPRVQTIRISSLAGKPRPERESHVHNFIPTKNVTLLAGDGAVGKSLLAAQLAVSTALTKTWLRWQVLKPGPVYYLGAEDDVDEMHIRFAEICAHEGADLADLKDLHLKCLAGHDAVLGAVDRSEIIQPTNLWKEIREEVLDIKPSLVIYDTKADLFAGNENVRPQARQFIGILRGLAIESGSTALLLDHPSLAGMASGSGTSGSTAWNNNSVRSRMYLTRVIEKDGSELNPNARVLHGKKLNRGQQGDEYKLRWHNHVFIPDDGRVAAAIQDVADLKAKEKFLGLVKSYNATCVNVTTASGTAYAPARFAKDPKAGGIKKEAFERAMRLLLTEGRIKLVDNGSPSRPSKTLVVVST